MDNITVLLLFFQFELEEFCNKYVRILSTRSIVLELHVGVLFYSALHAHRWSSCANCGTRGTARWLTTTGRRRRSGSARCIAATARLCGIAKTTWSSRTSRRLRARGLWTAQPLRLVPRCLPQWMAAPFCVSSGSCLQRYWLSTESKKQPLAASFDASVVRPSLHRSLFHSSDEECTSPAHSSGRNFLNNSIYFYLYVI